MSPRLRALVAVTVVALLGAACRGGAGHPGGSPSASPEPEVAVDVADVEVQRYDVPLGPDWMAVDEHGLWVMVDRAPSMLIDPESGDVLGTVDVGYELPLCQGIGAAYGVVYICRGTDLVRVDPETMQVVRRVPLHKEYGQGHIAGAFDRFWVLESDGSKLTTLDPATDEVVQTFQLPARGFDLTAGPDAIWVACKVDGKVLKVDPDTGEVLLTAEVSSPEYVTADAEQVWVAGASRTYRIDPDTGEVLATVDGGAEPIGDIASDDRYVYVRNADDQLIQIDKATGRRVAHLVSDTTTGGGVAVAGGDVWIAAVDDGTLLRLDGGALAR